MAYTPKTWEPGEIIEAEELNHMEQGIAAADAAATGTGTIGTQQLANGSVTTPKIANASVTNDKLDQEAVDSNNIRTGAITTPLIYDGAVTTQKIADGAVTTPKIADRAVTAAKLGESATDIVANTFSTSTAYSVGDYCIYSGALYRFTADKAAGAWDSTKATAIAIADDVADLKSALSNLENMGYGINVLSNVTWEIGTLDGSGNNSSSYSRVRSVSKTDLDGATTLRCTIASGYKFSIHGYKADESYVGNLVGSWAMTDTDVSIPSTVKYVRFIVAKHPDSNTASVTWAENFTCMSQPKITVAVNSNTSDIQRLDGADVFSGVTWERGSIDGNGADFSSTSRIRTVGYIDTSSIKAIMFDMDAGYKWSIFLYDSEKNYIDSSGWIYVSNIYTIPVSANYIRLSFSAEPDAWLADASISIHLRAYDKSNWVGLAEGTENGNVTTLDWFNATSVNKKEIPALDSNTTILALGDSITAAQDETGWVYHFQNMTGCTIVDKAVGGTSFGESETPDSGHWMLTQIGNVTTAQWESADLVIVACGTNDYGHGTPLDELKEKVQSAITAIKAKTSVPIVFITPIRRGNRLTDDPMLKMPIISGIISNVALANQCNVICGFDFPIPTYATGYVDNMTQDGLHPNALGANVFARSVINALT